MDDYSVEGLQSAFEDADLLPAVAGDRVSSERVAEPKDSNSVFQKLVTADDDVVGLVAYSIYKQNKLDWLRAFEKQRGVVPGAAEVAAYIIGENTPRRLATYRHLAESTLAGAAIGAEHAGDRPKSLRSYEPAMQTAKASTMSYLTLAIVVLIGIFLAARFGLAVK